MNITEYGYDEILHGKCEGTIGRLVAIYKERYDVVTDEGVFKCKLKASSFYNANDFTYLAVGDFVEVNIDKVGVSQILKVLDRKTLFKRLDPDPNKAYEQIIASNFDYVFIMQSLNNNFNIRRLERYLSLAWETGATPVIVLTKADLVEDYSSMLEQTNDVSLLANIHVISTKTGFGMDELKRYFVPKKTVVFLGSSGVGKSTLVNYLAGKEILKTGDIREVDARGRHTTTTRQLIMLENGTMIIDTPGLRELGMISDDSGIDKTFSDVEQYINCCMYSNCTHTNEPGCAILQAIEDGNITKERYEAYIKLKNEAAYVEDSESYIKTKKEKFKKIAKQIKNNGKGIY